MFVQNKTIRSSRAGKSNVLGLVVGIAAATALGTTLAIAKGGTAKPPTPKAPTPPVAVAPAPNPLFRTSPPRPAPLTPPSSAADLLNHQFSITGFIQAYDTTAPAACGAGESGGHVTVNGTKITIPCNLVVQMPANTLLWADFVNGLPAPSTTAPFDLANITATSANPSGEISLEGNIVNGEYRAALAYVSQQSLNSGSGIISAINLATGQIQVTSNSGTIATLEINDPDGRFGRATQRDDRLQVDSENPTITSVTGYPMCVPRSANDPECPQKNRPLSAGGCRDFNALGLTLPNPGAQTFFNNGANGNFCSSFVMKAPPGTPKDANNYPPVATATEPDASKQAPFEVGDFVSWAGSLMRGATAAGTDVISVHTLTANVGIFTQPGTLPVYVHMGEFGIAGDDAAKITSIAGISQEVQNRLVVEADVTDITTIIDVYLVDQDPVSGLEIQRWVTPLNMTGRTATGTETTKGAAIGFQGGAVANGTVYPVPTGFNIEGGIVTQWDGAQISRARIRASKATPNTLTSPSRNVRMVARSLCLPNNINPLTSNNTPIRFAGVPQPLTTAPSITCDTTGTTCTNTGGLGWVAQNTTVASFTGATGDGTCLGRATAANGLRTGQYQAPVFEFIFPENTGRGDPIVSSNFWDLDFLNGDFSAPGKINPQPW